MTIKELNKLIKEELDAFMQEDEMDDSMDMGDDIEVTTDEPEEEEDALDTLRQIYDMLKPLVEPEEEMGHEGDMEDMRRFKEYVRSIDDSPYAHIFIFTGEDLPCSKLRLSEQST